MNPAQRAAEVFRTVDENVAAFKMVVAAYAENKKPLTLGEVLWMGVRIQGMEACRVSMEGQCGPDELPVGWITQGDELAAVHEEMESILAKAEGRNLTDEGGA